MKTTEIIQQATENLPEHVRMNYVYGNIYLADLIDSHVIELRQHATKAGIYARLTKKLIQNMNASMNTYKKMLRQNMGDELYYQIGDLLDTMDEAFAKQLKIIYYSIRRQIDRQTSDSELSAAITHLSIIYLLAGLEMKRTTEYAEKVQQSSGIKMDALYDQSIKATMNTAKRLLEILQKWDADNMLQTDIQMAFNIFRRDLDELKIEISVIG